MKKVQIVTVKLQRPLITTSDYNTVLSYVVDDFDNQDSNPVEEVLDREDIEYIFCDDRHESYHKVYWEAEYRKGQKLNLLYPVRMDEWI